MQLPRRGRFRLYDDVHVLTRGDGRALEIGCITSDLGGGALDLAIVLALKIGAPKVCCGTRKLHALIIELRESAVALLAENEGSGKVRTFAVTSLEKEKLRGFRLALVKDPRLIGKLWTRPFFPTCFQSLGWIKVIFAARG